MARRRKPIAPSDIESQEAANARFVSRPSILPSDYPRERKRTRPVYAPWKRTLPSDYPKAPHKRPRYIQRMRSADLQVVKSASKRGIVGSIAPKPFVLSQFDARPINGIDFVDTFAGAEQVGGDTFTSTFNVPAGRVAIVRRLQLRIYMDGAPRGASGAPACALTMGFAINGNAVEQVTNIRVDDAICTTGFQLGMDIPLYFIVPEQSILTLTITNATGGFDFTFVAPVLSGNLLMSQGVNVSSEPGTQAPLPTVRL